ncbi:hypothetical protein SUGI_0371120 [Cryptomeria japonica]|nr:hypothetical protein SUGI_0371120 [Cryptomeria japonica]
MDTNELVLNKSSMAEILDQSSCAFCHSNLWRSCAVSHSGNCRCDPQAQRRKSQCTLSTTKEILDKQKKLFHSKEPHGVTVKEENPSPGPKHLGRHRAEQCFLGSSEERKTQVRLKWQLRNWKMPWTHFRLNMQPEGIGGKVPFTTKIWDQGKI